MIDIDIFFMNEALKEAKKAFQDDEVPVGCVVVHQKTIIARASKTMADCHNEKIKLKNTGTDG